MGKNVLFRLDPGGSERVHHALAVKSVNIIIRDNRAFSVWHNILDIFSRVVKYPASDQNIVAHADVYFDIFHYTILHT